MKGGRGRGGKNSIRLKLVETMKGGGERGGKN
jgi:hypothetical protein